MPHKFRMGRSARKHSPRIPHLSSLMGSKHRRMVPIPVDRDWSTRMPDDLGVMLNDSLGCCTASSKFHDRQARTFVASGNMVTESDTCVQLLYERSCGYVPGDPSTDLGGNIQDVLTYLLTKGLPVGDGSASLKIDAFVEIDPRNPDDLMLAIDQCGLIDVGFNVPAFLMPDDGSPPPLVWDVQPSNRRIIGGHDITQPGRVNGLYRTISWGRKDYQMTEAFFEEYVDEAYAVITEEWVTATGKTPFGLGLADWRALMEALK